MKKYLSVVLFLIIICFSLYAADEVKLGFDFNKEAARAGIISKGDKMAVFGVELSYQATPMVFDNGWEYTREYIKQDKKSIYPTENLFWTKIEKGKKIFQKQSEYTWFRFKLPETELSGKYLILSGLKNIIGEEDVKNYEFYINQKAIEFDEDIFFTSVFSLRNTDSGKYIYLKISSKKDFFVAPSSVYIIHGKDFFRFILYEDLLKMLLTFFFVAFALLLIPVWILSKKNEKKVFFAAQVFAISSAWLIIKNFTIIKIFTGTYTQGSYIFLEVPLILTAICSVYFFENIFDYKKYRLLKGLRFILLLYGMSLFVLGYQSYKEYLSSYSYGFYGAFGLLVFTMTTLIIMGMITIVKRKAGGAIYTISCGLIFFGMLSSMKNGYFNDIVLIFAFLIGLIIVVSRKFSESQKQIIKYSKELETKNDELKKLDKMKDEFLANTSHELRTPLNGIIGLTESMIENNEIEENQRKNLEMILLSSKRLNALVNDILDFSKLKHKNIELHLKTLDLKVVVDTVFTVLSPTANKKRLKLINNIPQDTYIWGDEDRLQQILYNLVGNSIKFTKEGNIEIYSTINRDFIEVFVKDTGIGIPKDKLNSIFESFEQADGSIEREFGGTGLGLTITKQLVELHGGEIKVESVIDEGSIFSFTLKHSKEKPENYRHLEDLITSKIKEFTPNIPLDEIKEVISKHQKGEHRILVVDDDPVNLKVLENMLNANNYYVKEAMNGEKALEIINSGEKFDLILLDIMMPKLSGYAVCQKIRETYPQNELPVVFLTAKVQSTDLVAGFNAGGNDYLTKPFSQKELISRIRTHISLSKMNIAQSRFVPKEFMSILGKESIMEVKLGDQIQKEITVLFSDIRAFTSMSEKMTPEENFNFINNYLNEVGPIIRDHNGFIDKYMGDAIMAIFPLRVEDAVNAAYEMQKKVQNLKFEYHPEFKISIGIGMHSGSTMLGILGEEKRLQGTVISDTVNIASRMEGLTKVFGSNILVTTNVMKHAKENGYPYRYIGKIIVKGKQNPEEIFEILETTDIKNTYINEFVTALNFYQKKQFSDAKKIIETCLIKNPEDKACSYYLEQIGYHEKYHDLPEIWDGAEIMIEK